MSTGTGRAFGSVRSVRHTRRVSTIPEIRTLPVPDGLEGERVDAAISRMFGFSRTKAAELAAAGKVQVDGSVVGKSERQGIVHRLDVGTSGLMAVAKSERAYTSLKRQFKERTVDKRYHTLVQGHPDPTSGTIDAPIGRHPQHDYKWAVTAEGKPSVTHYDLIEAFRAASLLDVKLETGRTHQIRVHMAAHRHPCVGDLTYGADPTLAKRLRLTRQWLHAVRLGFEHPGTGDWVEYASEYPDDLQQALDLVREETYG